MKISQKMREGKREKRLAVEEEDSEGEVARAFSILSD